MLQHIGMVDVFRVGDTGIVLLTIVLETAVFSIYSWMAPKDVVNIEHPCLNIRVGC